MRPYLEELATVAPCYISIYANAGLPNAFGEYDLDADTMAVQIREWAESGFLNIVGGCCGTTDEHIKCLADMVSTFKPREKHDVPDIMRLSGLEPFNYEPNEKDYRKTFINRGVRCNVAWSTIFKNAIFDCMY